MSLLYIFFFVLVIPFLSTGDTSEDADDLTKWKTIKARQSSNASEGGYHAGNALSKGCTKKSKTGTEVRPWLEIDLGMNAQVSSVSLQLGYEKNTTLNIWLGLDPWGAETRKLCVKETIERNGSFLCCRKELARHVVIQIASSENRYLSMCEVQIFGRAKNYTNVSSSTICNKHINYDKRATNGNWNDYLTAINCSWLRVDLIGHIQVSSFRLKVVNNGTYQISTANKTASFSMCVQPTEIVAGENTTLVCERKVVTSIEVRRINSSNLFVYEVEVYGVCAPGYYGKDCLQTCSVYMYCERGCSKADGSCLKCQPGFWGSNCSKNCSKSCGGDHSCGLSNGRCNYCAPGTFGDFCNRTCPTNCASKNCSRGPGICKKCKPGFWGKGCKDNCKSNCVEGCNKTTWKFQLCSSCIDGYFGSFCNKTCPTGCSRKCNRNTGECAHCKLSYFGKYCNLTCEIICDEQCDRNTSCECKPGSDYPICIQICPTGKYGKNCSSGCSEGCVNNTCDVSDGACPCKLGFAGDHCQENATTTMNDRVSDASKSPLLPAVIVTLLVILILTVVLGIWLKKKRSQILQNNLLSCYSRNPASVSEVSENNVMEVRPSPSGGTAGNTDVSKPMTIDALPDFVKHLRQTGGALDAAYNALPTNFEFDCTQARAFENKGKNRYKNIVPYDYNRVVLSHKDGDYVNASYIDGFDREMEFIAAQGPNSGSLPDFIRMLWEQEVNLVVMLTKLEENKKKKCEQYWPKVMTTIDYSSISVTTVSKEELPNSTERVIQIQHSGESRQLTQIQYTSWPDNGVPKSPSSFLAFLQRVDDLHKTSSSPTLVHCSAGVGRTGTLLAALNLLKEAEAEGHVDVPKTISKLRQQRMKMVQGVGQFAFLYDVLLVALHCGQTIYPTGTYAGVHGRLSDTQLLRQLSVVCKFDDLLTDKSTSEAQADCNKEKNRDLAILPINQYRPILMTSVARRTDYINAVFVKSFNGNNEILVTQSPLPDTTVDFWRLVNDYKVFFIVSLTKLSNEEEGSRYWSSELQKFGPFTVKLASEIGQHEYGLRRLRYTLGRDTREIWHLEVNQWDTDQEPSVSLFLCVMEEVMAKRGRSTKERLLVHCLNGCDRSGLFCALYFIIDQIMNEQTLDVFQAVKTIRESRPQFVSSLQQYRWLHEAALEYLNSYSTNVL